MSPAREFVNWFGQPLSWCEVIGPNYRSLGALFMHTDSHVVLLNHITDDMDLGPIKPVRTHHIEPEAAILIIPMTMVKEIKTLGPVNETL